MIETDRLILRPFTMDDFDDLYEYISDAKVVEYEPYKPLTREEARENLKWRCTTDEMFAVALKENGKVIGNVYFGNRDFNSKEIGYVFNKNFWGKGYAKEACRAVIADAFENGIHRVFAELDPDNENSRHLVESLGFVREAYFKQNVYFWEDEDGNPIWKDTYVYSLLAERVAGKIYVEKK